MTATTNPTNYCTTGDHPRWVPDSTGGHAVTCAACDPSVQRRIAELEGTRTEPVVVPSNFGSGTTVARTPAPARERGVNQATDKQKAFVRSLLSERSGAIVDQQRARMNGMREAGSFPFDEVRNVIEILLAPKAEKAAPKPGGLDLEVDRVYVTGDGRFVRVYKGRNGLYGKVRLDAGGWEYTPGVLPAIVGTPTAEQAAAWGHEHDRCVFCSTPLSDDGPRRSVEIGYGPICAEKYGLPWG